MRIKLMMPYLIIDVLLGIENFIFLTELEKGLSAYLEQFRFEDCDPSLSGVFKSEIFRAVDHQLRV